MSEPAVRQGTGDQYDGPDVCDICEGYGEVCVGFGLYSHMRPGIARCPDCDGSGQTKEPA